MPEFEIGEFEIGDVVRVTTDFPLYKSGYIGVISEIHQYNRDDLASYTVFFDDGTYWEFVPRFLEKVNVPTSR